MMMLQKNVLEMGVTTEAGCFKPIKSAKDRARIKVQRLCNVDEMISCVGDDKIAIWSVEPTGSSEVVLAATPQMISCSGTAKRWSHFMHTVTLSERVACQYIHQGLILGLCTL